jgi:formiminoglutamase
MAQSNLPHDPKWSRANTLFSRTAIGKDVGLLGIPACETSLSATSAHLTPAAIRLALGRYSTYSISHDIDLRDMDLRDIGDIDSPDGEAGELRVASAVSNSRNNHKLLIALGGDNSITYSVVRGLWSEFSECGLITLDAHLDLRDGHSNGSPVWRIIQAGMSGQNIVQIGISDFANSRDYA